MFVSSPVEIQQKSMSVVRDRPIVVGSDRSIQQRSSPGWKRGLDLVIFAVVAPSLAPVLGLVAIYIKIVSPGPVLFTQSRVGMGGRPFKIYKFRTMSVAEKSRDAEHRSYVFAHAGSDQPIKKPKLQSELIRGGKLIRKLSIDEFPQLINVLLGNMSIVGPRPDLLQIEDYQAWQLQRFEVLPGMTGLWQVSGKNRLTFDEMVNLDIKYANSRSLSHDLKIIARTALVIVKERNE